MEQEKRYIEEEEISLKELILKIQEFGRELLRNWLLIILITLPFVGYFVYKTFTTPPVYSAELTFMVNEDDGGGGMSSILGQFGLGGGGRGKNNLNKI